MSLIGYTTVIGGSGSFNRFSTSVTLPTRATKKTYFIKTYDVDQSRLPESYFETLAIAFEEHLPIVEVVDEILDEAVANVKES